MTESYEFPDDPNQHLIMADPDCIKGIKEISKRPKLDFFDIQIRPDSILFECASLNPKGKGRNFKL